MAKSLGCRWVKFVIGNGLKIAYATNETRNIMAIFNVHINDLPPEGKQFVGEIRPAVFHDLSPDSPTPCSPTKFDVLVSLDKESVLVEGVVETEFELECSRCLEKFKWKLRLDPYFSDEPREGRSNLDLTEFLREDILLALPGYPHCEDSTDSKRVCPAAGKFADASEYAPISDEAPPTPQNDLWAALDGLKGRIDK